MKKRTISVLLAAAMIASSLAAGAVTVHAEEEKKDKYVIGMSQCNLGEPWRVAMNDQIAMAAEKYPEFEEDTAMNVMLSFCIQGSYNAYQKNRSGDIMTVIDVIAGMTGAVRPMYEERLGESRS